MVFLGILWYVCEIGKWYCLKKLWANWIPDVSWYTDEEIWWRFPSVSWDPLLGLLVSLCFIIFFSLFQNFEPFWLPKWLHMLFQWRSLNMFIYLIGAFLSLYFQVGISETICKISSFFFIRDDRQVEQNGLEYECRWNSVDEKWGSRLVWRCPMGLKTVESCFPYFKVCWRDIFGRPFNTFSSNSSR